MGHLTRRAVVGTLLREHRALSIRELSDTLRSARPCWYGHAPRLDVRVAEILRYQCRLGRVERVRRGLYRAVPEALSRTTRWRYVNWERLTPPCGSWPDHDVDTRPDHPLP